MWTTVTDTSVEVVDDVHMAYMNNFWKIILQERPWGNQLLACSGSHRLWKQPSQQWVAAAYHTICHEIEKNRQDNPISTGMLISKAVDGLVGCQHCFDGCYQPLPCKCLAEAMSNPWITNAEMLAVRFSNAKAHPGHWLIQWFDMIVLELKVVYLNPLTPEFI